MSQREIMSEFNDSKMLTTVADQSNFKLPKISNSNSRAVAQSRRERRQYLPSFSNSTQKVKGNLQKPKVVYKNKMRFAGNFNKDEFAHEIEQKLKNVLNNVSKGQSMEQDPERVQEQEFEEVIRYNKQKIKQQKQEQQQRQENEKAKKSLQSNKCQPLQRRISPQKKVTSKTKSKAKAVVYIKNKEFSEKRQIPKQKKRSNERNIDLQQNKRSGRQPSNLPPKEEAKLAEKAKHDSLKSLSKRRGSVNLFDNIHNLLRNPKSRAASMMGKADKKTIETLENKLRVLNDQLGHQKHQQTKSTDFKMISEASASDWKRISYNKGYDFSCHTDSNFEKEVERIAELQQRSDSAIKNYLQHQKMLVELGLLQKIYPNTQNKTQ